MELSVVTTVFYSAPYVLEFYERISREIQKLNMTYEIIFVNDGSPDESLRLVRDLQKRDRNIVVIDLSRNFGHHKAMMTGLRYAAGDHIFLIDCDLEEEPEWLSQFFVEMREKKTDVVYGVQRTRKGGWFERISGALFYRFFAGITGMAIPLNATTARLMTLRYVQSLLQFTEREPIMHALLYMTGYAQVAMPVVKHDKGATTYTLRRKIALAVNAVTSFSDRPLVGVFYTGAAISTVSTLYIVFLICGKFFLNITVDGWTSLIVSIWFLGGLTIFFIGLIGIYLARIFTEVKKRPVAIVRAVHKEAGKSE